MPRGIYKRTVACNLAHSGFKISEQTRRKLRMSHLGLKQTKEHVENRVAHFKNESHWQWKGDNASYRAKHIWVEKRLGKPHYCEHCKRSDLKHRSYHWANISGEYKRDVKDWLRLCVTCHKHYDA